MKGWVITKQHYDGSNLPSRVGWGQVDAEVVQEDANYIFGRSITMTTDLDASKIDDPVKFRTMSDDGIEEGLTYSGVISKDWIDSPDDALAFAPLRFAETDCGDTIMEYYLPGCKCLGDHPGHEPGRWEML